MSLLTKTLFLLIFMYGSVYAQNCTELGQNPGTAFPVCGTNKFVQNTVPVCSKGSLPGPCAEGPFPDKNPFWYKFTSFKSGTLGFLITPNNLGDDYDWQLFDITGKDPDDVYTNRALFVACNWSGETGLTGASSGGNSLEVCSGPGKALFSSMPTLQEGHEYLLLISHFTNSQSGYTLEFTGGTADITDPKDPKLSSASSNCSGNEITVVMNKKMKCNTLAANGSDFTISGGAVVTAAKSLNCAASFDMSSVVLTLDKALAPGTYTVQVKKGSDGNSILDNCDEGIPDNDQVSFSVQPLVPTPMDSLTKPGCAPNKLQLVFSKPMLCSSIAANGSDFMVKGPYTINVTGATTVCNQAGESSVIELQLSAALVTAGAFEIELVAGADGNTIIDQCGQQTPAGSKLPFNISDTVSAEFSYQLLKGCLADTALFSHPVQNGVNDWQWIVDNQEFGHQPNVKRIFETGGQRKVGLLVTNGVCTDSHEVAIDIEEKLDAAFEISDVLCPKDPTILTNVSTGPVATCQWDFGNGATSSLREPGELIYQARNNDSKYSIRLIVGDGNGCSDTATKQVTVVTSCLVVVPTAFTPNGDGINDYLFPANAYKASDLLFRVFNRYGQLVFETRDWMKRWDGRLKGRDLETGTYVWTLQYTHRDTNKRFTYKGSTVLIR
jgi:gliding motility-associated-like protein